MLMVMAAAMCLIPIVKRRREVGLTVWLWQNGAGRDRTMQEPVRDRIREFETAPPEPSPPTETGTAPAHLPSWISSVVDAAPLVLVITLGVIVLSRRRWRLVLARVLFAVAGALVVGGAVFYLTYLLGCRVMTCVDAAGLVPILAGLVIGFLAGITGLGVLWRFAARRQSTRGTR